MCLVCNNKTCTIQYHNTVPHLYDINYYPISLFYRFMVFNSIFFAKRILRWPKQFLTALAIFAGMVFTTVRTGFTHHLAKTCSPCYNHLLIKCTIFIFNSSAVHITCLRSSSTFETETCITCFTL